jgi:hypothetical protein
VLLTRHSRPPAAAKFRPHPRADGSNEPATADGASGRVHPRVPRRLTGSYPRLEIPAPHRWAVAIGLAGVLALYFLHWSSAPNHAGAPAAIAAPHPVPDPAPQLRAAADPPLESTRPLELPPSEHAQRAADAPQVARPVVPRAEARELRATLPRRARPASADDEAARDSPSQPMAAGSLTLEPSPAIAPAPLPVAPPSGQPAPQRSDVGRISSEAESTQGWQPSAGGGTTPVEVRVAAVNVRGSLAVSVVRRAIERIRPMLTQCYRKHLKPGHASFPRLQVSATIDEVGRVRGPSVEGGTLPALNACVVKVTSKMVSDAPDTGTVRATWSLSL